MFIWITRDGNIKSRQKGSLWIFEEEPHFSHEGTKIALENI